MPPPHITLELQKTADPAFVVQLGEYLKHLCDAGLVERVPSQGETAYRWRGPAQASRIHKVRSVQCDMQPRATLVTWRVV